MTSNDRHKAQSLISAPVCKILYLDTSLALLRYLCQSLFMGPGRVSAAVLFLVIAG
jgi:hypothetical protein